MLVTGVGGPAGRAAATWLTAHGARVLGADVRDVTSPAWELRRIPPASDPAFARALLALVAEAHAALLVPTVSEELPLVARLHDALRAAGCALAMGPPPGVDVAADKLLTAEALSCAGVPVPRSLPGSTPRAEVVVALGLPLLAKPRVGRGGRGVKVFRDEAELPATPRTDLVWQEFIPGDEFDVNLFVEEDGGTPAAVVLKKTALRDGETGNAAGVERVDRPALGEVAIRAARALRLAGPLDVDVRLRRDGTPAILEVNARLGANSLSAPEVLEALDAAWRGGRCA
ncbi:MAG TPA: ATP-grasp domain-containing protein [Anaeromyxobacteraceae bacterium]|nr:ATP-grasp domain-containing protein [Anaeromyxobacteraceae bacterium]